MSDRPHVHVEDVIFLPDGTDIPSTPFTLAALEVYRAVRVEGPAPEVHRNALAKLQTEWPTLYRALMRLVRECEYDPADHSPHVHFAPRNDEEAPPPPPEQ